MARSLRCHPENEAQSPSPNMEEFAALPPPVRFGKSEDHGTRFAFDCVARLLNAVARQSQPSREAVRGTSYQELPRDSVSRERSTIAEQCASNSTSPS